MTPQAGEQLSPCTTITEDYVPRAHALQQEKESEVAQSCLTLCNPMDCSLPGSSVHGIFRQEYWGGVPLPSPKNVSRCCQVSSGEKDGPPLRPTV